MSKKNQSPMKLIMIITLIVFAMIAALVVINNMKSEQNVSPSFEEGPSIEGQPVLGKSDAPVTVVEFGDFKCPACKAWGQNIFPKLVEDYVDTGKVKFSYINVLFHGDESKLGSVAAEAVYKQNPDSYWDFNKALFDAQPDEDHDSLWITMEKIKEVASAIPGIDTNQLEKDIQSQEIIDEVNNDSALVEEYKVQQTPSIMVNGTMLEDPFDYEKIKSLIDQSLEDK
ncbi:DsbA family protein [Cytobacillus firmus]|uniref:Thiol-disulfide oxidoreductase n=1 Tax=Cytobacillus firmus DS1 TaxID=1307436 RepID=W7L9Q2_CYTFI|nr:DsbA family protein [Cytobacillus firmus]EWG08549.1 thiol-disulfide oxidoreductase [Cytobacillus firmus DS1]MBG9549691.1 dihydroneopterin aldolase [Cytobacillus firmus]MBG9604055.1 dihydroneopterin aldolase [Cytobacillus firmus]MED1942731.1 DsbA family protein [Cytobacillus firmus]